MCWYFSVYMMRAGSLFGSSFTMQIKHIIKYSNAAGVIVENNFKRLKFFTNLHQTT